MNEKLRFQREKYVDGCSRLRVEKQLGKISPIEYETLLLDLGRECQDWLLSEPEDLVPMFAEIKEKTGKLLDSLGVN